MNILDEAYAAFPGAPPELVDQIMLHFAGERMPSHAALLRQMRKRRALELWGAGGVTIVQIAERVGVSKSTAYRWLGGDFDPE